MVPVMAVAVVGPTAVVGAVVRTTVVVRVTTRPSHSRTMEAVEEEEEEEGIAMVEGNTVGVTVVVAATPTTAVTVVVAVVVRGVVEGTGTTEVTLGGIGGISRWVGVDISLGLVLWEVSRA